jgi:hypothetical protein
VVLEALVLANAEVEVAGVVAVHAVEWDESSFPDAAVQVFHDA